MSGHKLSIIAVNFRRCVFYGTKERRNQIGSMREGEDVDAVNEEW